MKYGDQKYRELVGFSSSARQWQEGLTALSSTCCRALSNHPWIREKDEITSHRSQAGHAERLLRLLEFHWTFQAQKRGVAWRHPLCLSASEPNQK